MDTTVLPDFDISTRCGSGFLLRYIAPRMGPVHLVSYMAGKRAFDLSSPHSDVIIGVGHGEPDVYYGQNRHPILKVGEYSPADVQGKFIKLLSCSCGLQLGPDIMSKGALAFQGYSEEFVWLFDAEYLDAPWKDPMATEFLDSVIFAFNVLLDGGSNLDIYNAEIIGYNTKLALEEDNLVKGILTHDRDALVHLGADDAKIQARPKVKLPFLIPLPPLISLGA